MPWSITGDASNLANENSNQENPGEGGGGASFSITSDSVKCGASFSSQSQRVLSY